MIFPENKKNLVISYFFPSYINTGGTVVAKRIIEEKQTVDVLQNDTKNTPKDESLNNILDNYIDLRIVLDAPYEIDWTWESIKSFTEKGMNILNNISKEKPYDTIYSRSMPRQSHYLAYEYKKQYPETTWTAEFSDPIIFDIYGEKRIKSQLNDQEYLKNLNNILKKENYPQIETTTTEYICELLPYLFADKIIFTNKNQQEIMLTKFKEINPNLDIKDKVKEKSIIKPQPTLPKEYYNKTPVEYEISDKYVNLAYFGLFYGTRNFEDVFYALENIDETLKKYFKLHIFTSDKYFIERSISDLKTKENIILNDNRKYLEFLNLTQKFDALILTDANTENYYKLNPYLPSKFADYLGSGTDIWAITEKNSILNQSDDIKYKSQLGDYHSSSKILNKIISEKLSQKEYKVVGETLELSKEQEEDNVIKYLQMRNMSLTNSLNKESSLRQERENEINELKRIIDELRK